MLIARVTKYSKNSPASVGWGAMPRFRAMKDGIITTPSGVGSLLNEYLLAFDNLRLRMSLAPEYAYPSFGADNDFVHFTVTAFDSLEELSAYISFVSDGEIYADLKTKRDALAKALDVTVSVFEPVELLVSDLREPITVDRLNWLVEDLVPIETSA